MSRNKRLLITPAQGPGRQSQHVLEPPPVLQAGAQRGEAVPRGYVCPARLASKSMVRSSIPKGETCAPRAPRIAPRASLEYLLYAFLTVFQGGRDAVASGVHIQQRRPPLHPPHQYHGGCSCPHPLPGGGGGMGYLLSAAQRPKGCPTGCPSLQGTCFATFRVSG